MMEEELIKKLEEINNLLKALGKLSSIAPSLRGPTIKQPTLTPTNPAPIAPKVGQPLTPPIPKPKKFSNAAKNLKNPVKQAEQVSDMNAKAFAMQQAKTQVKAQHNQFAFKSEDSALFYAFRDGQRLHSEPMTKENAHNHFGKDIELKPVVIEKLSLSPNGQWTLE